MTPSRSRFLDPAILAGIGDLRLAARTVVEGYFAGQHLDLRSGSGVEFSQYRSYQPGDDPRRVDWRVHARSDRYFVRESEIERDVTVRFLLDASASMAHRGSAVSKMDYARFLVASLAYLADRQSDHLAFHAVHDGEEAAAPLPRRRPLDHLLHRLEQLEPRGRWPRWGELRRALPRGRGRELVVVVSDLWDGEPGERGDGLGAALATFRALGHEVLLFQLLGRDELELDFEGDLLFEDLETGETVRGNAAELRGGYLERLEHHLAAWRRHLAELGAVYELLVLDQPLDRALRELLLRRAQLP